MYQAGQSALRRYSPIGIVAVYAAFVIAWAASADWLTTLVVGNQSALAKISVAKALIFVSVTVGLLFLLYRVGRPPAGGDDTLARFSAWRLAPVLVGLALVVPLADIGMARKHAAQLESDAYAVLSAVGERKARQIEDWLAERDAYAGALFSSHGFVRQVRDFLYHGDRDSYELVIERLYGMLRGPRYSGVLLFDAHGRTFLAFGDEVGIPPALTEIVSQGMSKAPMRHVHTSDAGTVYMDWTVPLILDHEDGEERIGTVVLRTNFDRFLSILVDALPAAGASTSTILFRPGGGSVIEILNRGQAAVARPQTDSLALALGRMTAATRADEPGTFDGADAHGVRVLAAYRPVPGTDWRILVKIDHREVMAPLRKLVTWVTLITVCVIVLLAAAILFVMWRQRQRTRSILLRAEAEKNRLLQSFHDMPFIGIAVISPLTGRPLHVNDHLCRVLDYTGAELMARSWDEVLHADARADVASRLQRVAAGELDGIHNDVRVVRRDGAVISAIVHVQCVRDERGTVEYFIATLQDISERKAFEEALREREADLNRAQAMARIGSWSLDVRNNVLSWSAECRRIFGLPPGTPLSYESFLSCVHPDDQKRVDQAWSRALEGKPYRIDHRIIVGGRVKWIREHAELQLDEKGNLIGGIGTAQDITEQRQSEEHLRQAAMVFERSGEGIIVTDAGMRISLVNPALCRMTGYGEEEILGHTPALFRSEHHDPIFYETMLNALERSGHWKGEVWKRRKDGAVFPTLFSISALKDDAGQLTGYVGVYTDISILKASEAKLAHAAYHDALTGLPNRLLMRSRLEYSLEAAHRRDGHIALLMLDLDGFGDVNDSFGHPAGDELLRLVAERLKQLNIFDTVARFSGDEFALLLENPAHRDDVAQVAANVVAVLSEPWRLSNGSEVRVGVSVGISFYPEHAQSAVAMLQKADAALYRAKAEGRGRIRFFSDEMTEAARVRIDLQARLHRAFKDGQLRVHYQPQVEIASGRIIGAEALLRWTDPERGPVSPADWIPLAEETGLIVEIGAWVLREVCGQGRRWLDGGLAPVSLAVNLSARQFRYGDIGAVVTRVLSETGFPPQRLELEITESAIMAHADEADKVLRGLRAEGIRLAIDDFGTGYSSLAYLKRFPLDVLKIDGRFIEGVPCDVNDCELVRAIVAMAHALNLKVLAEGVENEEQLAFVSGLGCDRYQGYLRSPAVDASTFEGFLAGAQ